MSRVKQSRIKLISNENIRIAMFIGNIRSEIKNFKYCRVFVDENGNVLFLPNNKGEGYKVINNYKISGFRIPLPDGFHNVRKIGDFYVVGNNVGNKLSEIKPFRSEYTNYTFSPPPEHKRFDVFRYGNIVYAFFWSGGSRLTKFSIFINNSKIRTFNNLIGFKIGGGMLYRITTLKNIPKMRKLRDGIIYVKRMRTIDRGYDLRIDRGIKGKYLFYKNTSFPYILSRLANVTILDNTVTFTDVKMGYDVKMKEGKYILKLKEVENGRVEFIATEV